MSFNPRTDSSSPPGHQDLVDSLAAPAQVDLVGGTIEFVLRMALSARMNRGETLQQACSGIYRAMVRLSKEHGISAPAWPHDFAYLEEPGQ